MSKNRFARSQRMPVVNAILTVVVLLVVLQLWLLVASMNTYLSGHTATAIPAAAASTFCLLLNLGLLRYLYRLE